MAVAMTTGRRVCESRRMTTDEIEALLFEEEGTTLDFKRDQYPFDQASDEDKSELLKDILAFANAFRRTDAFILIGIEDVKGGRGKVMGVASQLDDAKLQQFVNSKTQRAVTFSYRDAVHDGRPIGIIHVPLQQRPLYAKAGYGKVKKGVVYLRRGSSTDEATPDEIAQMGAQQVQAHGVEPSLELGLFERETGRMLGHELAIQSTLLQAPPESDIPDYRENRDLYSSIAGSLNRDYYRELTRFTQIVNFVRPLSLALRNSSSVSAHDVRMIFEIEDVENRLLFMDEHQFPRAPKARYDLMFVPPPVLSAVECDVDVSRVGSTWRIQCLFGKIQPHDTVKLSSDLYVGSMESGLVSLDGKLYADNIGHPVPARLDLTIETRTKEASLEDIERLEYERFAQTPEGKRLLAEARDSGGEDGKT